MKSFIHESSIFVSIASYRDPDLLATVKSCYDNSAAKDSLFFSIVSQAEEFEHPDLSFIPESQIRYVRVDWRESQGVCWARSIAQKDIKELFFLQIDSHSRFVPNWDSLIVSSFYKSSERWGEDIILTNYPDPFEVNDDGTDNLLHNGETKKFYPVWDDSTKMVQAASDWPGVEDLVYGDEVLFLSANSLFTTSAVISKLPYDPDIYFTGEEFSLAIRAYTRNIKMISPTVKYMFTKYNRENVKRRFHWQDHKLWWRLNSESYQKVYSIIREDDLGDFGIGSSDLFSEYQKRVGIDLKLKYGLAD
jgi:hypothetical protein